MAVMVAARAEGAVAVVAAPTAAVAAETLAVAVAEMAATTMVMAMAGRGQDKKERRLEGGIGGSMCSNLFLHMHGYQFFYLHICTV